MKTDTNIPFEPFEKTYFIKNEAECNLETELSNGSTMKVHLLFEKIQNSDKWQVSGEAELHSQDPNQDVFKSSIPPRILQKGQGVFLGGMGKNYATEGRTINVSPDIPLELLSNISNEKILKISPARNGVSITSGQLQGRVQQLPSNLPPNPR